MGYEYYGKIGGLFAKRQEIRCPRCNGTGKILYPSDIGREQIDGDVVMSILHETQNKMYLDLLKERKLDGTITEGHYTLLDLWSLR